MNRSFIRHRLFGKINAYVFFCIVLLGISFSSFGQHPVIDPSDPVVTYDPDIPPTTPPWGTMVKWVRTKRLGWDTDQFKAYFYKGMPFRIMFPKNYDPSGNTKYPMVIMLHGRGERGTIYDNEYSMKHGGSKHRDAVNNGTWPGFVLYPQNTTGYFAESHFSILSDLINNHFPDIHVNINRISVHGLSAGGQATWNTVIDFPKDYAAAIPMSAAGLGYLDGISSLQYIPIWLSQGGKDSAPHPNTSEQVTTALWDSGVNIRYTLYPSLGHGVWNTHYNESDFFPYMERAHKANPTVTSGESALLFTSSSKLVTDFVTKTEFCPGETINVPMGLTAGFEEYEWRKDGVIIPGANSNTYTATELGTYDARFKRAGEWTIWSPIPVEVKIKEATQTPDINVVGLKSKVLPAPDGSTSVELELPNGYIEYAWFKEGSGNVIGSERTITVSSPGNYVASVQEKFGCSSNLSSPFKVVDANGNNEPDAVNGFVGTAISKTELRLNWSDNPNPTFNETGFELYRSETAGGPYELIEITNADQLSFTDAGLIPNTNYYYLIRAVNENGASANSAEISVKTLVDDIAPAAPLNVRVTKKTLSSITLAWDESVDDVGIFKYEIYRGPNKAAVVDGTTGTIYNLVDGEIYTFTVKARDFAGNISPASSQIVAAPGFSGLNYKYYEGSWSVLPDFNSLIPVKEGLSNNVDINVRDQNDNFGFLWEGFINIETPGTYTFETRSDDGSKLYIGGYDEANLLVDNDGLHGMRNRSGNFTFSEAGAYPIAITFFERGGGQGMEVYWASTDAGISRQRIPDNAFQDDTPIPDVVPNAPVELLATAISYNSVELNWTDMSNDETGFQIYRSTQQTGGYIPVGIVSPYTTTFIDENLSPETTYYYQVIALGQYGQSQGLTGPPVSILPMYNGIAAIDNASGTGYIMYSEQRVHERFSSNPPHSQNADHVIAVRYNNGSWQYDNNSNYYNFVPGDSDLLLAEVDFGADQINPLEGSTGVTNGIEYGYADGDLVFRANRWGTSNNAGEFFIEGTFFNRTVHSSAVVTTLALPEVPNSPENFTAVPLSSTEITLSWDDMSDTETSYEIYRSVSNGNNYLLLETLNSNTESYTNQELFPNTTYFYEIKALNEGGASISRFESATTLNNVPDLSPIGDITMRFETKLDIAVIATDPDSEQLTLTVDNLPSFASFEDYGDGTGNLAFSPVFDDAGIYTNIIVRAEDQNGGIASDTLILTVDANTPPTLLNIQDVILDEGTSTSVVLTANDPDGNDLLTWVSNLPEFAQITPHLDGTATLSINPYFTDSGIYEIDVQVNDPDGGSASSSFTITVNEIDPNERILMNFVNNTVASAPWNNITSLNSGNLINDKGENSGASLNFVTNVWNSFRDGAVTGDNSGVYPDDVIRDYYYFGIFNAPETVSMKVTGLDPSKPYKLTFFGSSKWANVPDNGTTNYTVGDNTVSVYVQNNTQNTASINDVFPNENGEVEITMSKAAGTPVGYINALVVEYIHDRTSVPSSPRSVSTDLVGSDVVVNWIDAPFNEKGFEIYRSLDGNNFVKIGETVSNVTSFTDSDISESETYFYQVYSYNDNGLSDVSNTSEITIPNTPPSIELVSSLEMNAGQTETILISASDPSSATIDISVSGLPAFATYSDIDVGSGELVFSPTFDDIGTYLMTITATDDQNAVTQKELTVIITENQLYSVEVNFSGNVSANGWNNTAKAPAANDTFSGLMDINGNSTSVAITLNTAFGGVYGQGATTGNNSGVVPDNVLKEYYWFGTFGAPEIVQMTVSGLDLSAKYTFKFIGSSVFSGSGITDNGETVYTIGSKSVSVDVQGNTSELGIISNVVPSSSGEVLITITKGVGAQVGYINGLIINAFEAPIEAVDQTPTDFAAIGSSKTSIDLTWQDNAFEELGYEVYRRSDDQFSLIGTTGPDATSYTDGGLSSGQSFEYKVRAMLPNDNFTEYSNNSSAGTMAFAIYINLNGDPFYNAPEPWNNIGFLPDNGISVAGFKNEFGNESGIVLDFVQSMTGSNDWGTNTGDNSGIYPDAVLESFFFMEALEEATVLVEGLDQSYVYNFNFLGAIETNYNVFTDFTIGDEKVTNSQTWNTTTFSSIKGVNPDVNNSVEIHVVSTPGSRWSIWNSLVIEAYPNTGGSSNARTDNTSASLNEEDASEVTFGDVPYSLLGLGIYPNPVKAEINIISESSGNSQPVTIELFDLNGVKILSQKNIEFSSEVYSIDVSNLNLDAGVYLLTISGNGLKQNIKILKE